MQINHYDSGSEIGQRLLWTFDFARHRRCKHKEGTPKLGALGLDRGWPQ